MFLHTSQVKYVIANILLTTVTIMIASVAGVLGAISIQGCLVFSNIFIKNYNKIVKKWQKVYLSLLILVSIPFFYVAVNYIKNYNDFMKSKFTFEYVIKGDARNRLKDAAIKNIRSYGIIDFLLGRGCSNVYYNMGIIADQTSRRMVQAELDQYDLLSSYGIFLGGIFLIIPILLTIRFIKHFFKYRTSFYFFSSLAMLLFIFHGFTAGHAYTNVMVMPVVAVLYFCSLKQIKVISENCK
jgi:hypothetical protein